MPTNSKHCYIGVLEGFSLDLYATTAMSDNICFKYSLFLRIEIILWVDNLMDLDIYY